MEFSNKISISHSIPTTTITGPPPYTVSMNTPNIQIGQDGTEFGIKINEYDLTNTLKQIKINSQEFSNGVQTLPYTQMYETINACQACVYPQLANILKINDTLITDNAGGDTANLNTTSLILDSNSGTNQFTLSNNSTISSTQSINISPTGDLINNGTVLQNNGGYVQSTAYNIYNPTTIPLDIECFIINLSNSVVMDVFSYYLNAGYSGWTCKVVNFSGSTFTITSPDARFVSWLHGNYGSSYDIPNYSYIQITAIDPAISGLGFNTFFIEDGSGYKTVNTTANATHYLNFSDSSSTGVGNIQKTDGLQFNPSTDILTITNGVNSLNLSPTSNPATSISVTDTNTGGPYYPIFVDGSGQKSIFTDSVTTPFTYNPSTGTLSPAQITCNVMNQTTTSSSCTLFSGLTTGSVTIAGTAQTTGSINIGSTTTTTGLCNVRPPLVLSRQLRTTNSTSYSPSNVLDLGFTTTTFGSSFTTTALLASTNTNLMSYAFTSANYGTYLFTASCIITPTDTTAERQVLISISGSNGTITQPYYDMKFIPIAGSAPQLTYTRVIQIYSATTIYLVGYCQGSSANVQTTTNNGLFTYTRIA